MIQTPYDLLLLLASECTKRNTYLLTITQVELRTLYFQDYSKPISPRALNAHLKQLEDRSLITRDSPHRSPRNAHPYFQPTTYALTEKAILFFAYLVTDIDQILNSKGGN